MSRSLMLGIGKRFTGWCVLGMSVLGLSGCKEPTQPMPVAPPGVVLKQALPANTPTAQAMGESNVASAGAMVSAPPLPEKAAREAVTLPSGLVYQTFVEGTGLTAESGKKVQVHYIGRLTDGKVFDSSREKNAPFEFVIDKSEVIQGWHQGVAGMKVGERRVLTIPPQLGYGEKGAGNVIPPNATLVFDIELTKVD